MNKFQKFFKFSELGPKFFLEELIEKGLEKFPTFMFSRKTNNWMDVSNESPEIITKNTISFITYNVWFENINWINRLKSLFKIFEIYSPDYLCLQEVTENFLRDLLKNEFIRENYCFSGNFRGGYDVLILSKYKSKFYSQKFTSGMGRNLLITEIKHTKDQKNYNNIMISTSHFESLNNADLRKDQLQISFEILSLTKNAFLMGDFNFDSTWINEEKNIDKNYNDCWFIYKNRNILDDEERYTMPKNKHFIAWRPDRILYKNENIFDLEYFEIIGKNEIPQDLFVNNVKTPSDHYGLFALFNIKN